MFIINALQLSLFISKINIIYKRSLGNARVNYAKNSEGVLEITDSNNYYPFGILKS